MPEKIEVFKLDIDVDAAISSTVKMKDATDALKQKYDTLRKSETASTAEIVKSKGAYDAANTSYKVSQREIQKLTSLEGKEIKTISEARTALSVVGSQWAKQTKLYGENSAESEKLTKKKTELTNRLKTLEGQTGDNTRNVGNYTEGMKGAIQESGLFGQAQAAVNTVAKVGAPIITFLSTSLKSVKVQYVASTAATHGFSKAQIAANVTTAALSAGLKILKFALIATGIGAILVLVGTLIAYFTRTQAGADFVSKSLAVMGAAFDVILDRLADVGAAFAKMFSGDVLGGLADLKNSMAGVGDEMEREVKLAGRLEKVLQGVEKAEINLDIRRSAANARLNELKLATDDITKSEGERLEAAKEFAKIETRLTAEQVSNQEKKVAALLGFDKVNDDVRKKIRQIGQEGVSLDQLGISKSKIVDAEEFRDEIGKLFDLEANSSARQLENQNKLNSIQEGVRKKREADAKERATQSKARIDADIKESKTRLDLFIAQNEGKSKSLKDALTFEETVRDERQALLEEELTAGKKTAAEYELEKYKIKTDFLEAQAAVTVEFADKELDIFRNTNQSRLEAGQLLTDELVGQEQQRLDRIAAAERTAAAAKLENDSITREEYNTAINAIDEANAAGKNEVQTERDTQAAEKKAIDFENEMILAQGNFLQEQELKAVQLEQDRRAEIASVDETGADISLINDKYAKRDQQIEVDKNAFKVDVASATLGSMVDILGKESAAGKAAAIAQAGIETYKSATSAYSAMAGIPVVGPALGAIAAAAAISAGLKTVQKITSTKKPDLPKAAKGMTMEGRSHAAGGETIFDRQGNPLAEIEGGENLYVVNKRASGLINSLSNINQSTGGIPLSQSTTYAAAGGAISRNTNGINYDLLAERMAAAYSAIPAPQVAVTEINRGSNNYKKLVDVANF